MYGTNTFGLDISMNNVNLLPSRTADLPLQPITTKPVKETLQEEFLGFFYYSDSKNI